MIQDQTNMECCSGPGRLKNYLVPDPEGGLRTAVFQLVNENGWEKNALKVVNVIEKIGRKKDLSPEDADNYNKEKQRLCQNAEDEVRLMYKLRNCPGVVTYLDYKQIDWQEENRFGCDLLIRMELLKSPDIFRNDGRVTENEILRLGIEICSALIECHKKGIIHRDIKPANIFINEEGRYKLGDFGIARILSRSDMASTTIGTRAYAAPEQIRSSRYDFHVDIYSLGLTLYQLANRGYLPFCEAPYVGEREIIERISAEKLPAPSAASSGLSRALQKACMCEPSRRYRSAEEFRKELVRIRDKGQTDNFPGVTEHAMYMETEAAEPGEEFLPYTRSENTKEKRTQRKIKKKNRKRIGLALVLVLSILLGGILTAIRLNQRKDSDSEEEQSAGKSEEAQEEAEKIQEEPIFLQAERVQKYNDIMYTAYDLERPGWYSISGVFTDSFLAYKNHIYWRNTGGPGRFPCELIRMDLNGKNKVTLVENVDSARGFTIYNDVIYYVALDENGGNSSCKIDLDTLEVNECPPYYIVAADEDKWIVASFLPQNQGLYYICKPGFEKIQSLDYSYGRILGYYNNRIYFEGQEEDGYRTYSYDVRNGEVKELLTGMKKSSVMGRKHLYYARKDSEVILCRLDLDTQEVDEYGIGDINIYMGRKIYEVDDEIYFIQFHPEQAHDNSELWRLDTVSGEYSYVGSWYNETAVNVTETFD